MRSRPRRGPAPASSPPLPVVTFFGLWMLRPAYITILLDDPGGQTILATAIGMLGMGMMVMRSIIRRSLA